METGYIGDLGGGMDRSQGSLGSQSGMVRGKDGINENISEESLNQLGDDRTVISFENNPHVRGQKFEIFERCLQEKEMTIRRARELGASLWDLKNWFQKSSISIKIDPSLSSSPKPGDRKKVKNEKLTPQEKVEMLQQRKREIEQNSETSRTLQFSPPIRSPASKHLRFENTSDIINDLPDSADAGISASSNQRDSTLPPSSTAAARTEETGIPNLQTVLSKLDQMHLKMDTMATKEDLRMHMDETKLLIAHAVDPLKDEVSDIKDRLTVCEQQQMHAEPKLSPEIFKILQQQDVASKQISFSGFRDTSSADERITILTDLMSRFSSFPFVSLGHFYQGPKNNRQMSKASYVEFANADIAKKFLDTAKGSNNLNVDGVALKAKAALSAINRKRNWALREAANQAKLHKGISSAEIFWKDRVVKYGSDVIFSQSQYDLTGTFHGVYKDLKLP